MKESTLGKSPLSLWFDNEPKPSFDAEKLFSYFQRLLEAEPDDSILANSLRKVCQKVLSDQATFSQEIVHRAVEIASQVGDLDLLELALSSNLDGLTPATFLTIGNHLSSVTLDHFKKVYETVPIYSVEHQKLTHSRLTKPISSLKKLYKRHELIRSLTIALLEERANQPKKDVDEKIEWLGSTLDELLTTSDALEAHDAKALFEMLGAPRLPDNFLDR